MQSEYTQNLYNSCVFRSFSQTIQWENIFQEVHKCIKNIILYFRLTLIIQISIHAVLDLDMGLIPTPKIKKKTGMKPKTHTQNPIILGMKTQFFLVFRKNRRLFSKSVKIIFLQSKQKPNYYRVIFHTKKLFIFFKHMEFI